MTGKSNHPEFDDAVQAMKSEDPSAEDVRAASGRVWQKLSGSEAVQSAPEMIRGCEDVINMLPAYQAGELTTERALLVKTHLRDCVACRRKAEGRESANVLKWAPANPVRATAGWPRWAAVAAMVVFAVVSVYVYSMYFTIPAGARAMVQSLNGAAYRVTANGDQAVKIGDELQEGDVLRTASGGHAYVKLSDGSLVEVRERSEFAVKARGKNMTIALDRGAVLVQAAHRKVGHLYVKTPDCRVAVTGTVFAVDSGVKGSRVSVVEGSVEVQHGGSDDRLSPGDQVVTSDNMTTTSVETDISWSQDFAKHLELLAQFKKLEKRLEQVQLPALRYKSNLLGRMPADAVVYASLPNAGQALEEANKILQDQIQQSDSLRTWFTHGDAQAAEKFNDTIEKVRALSDYLGDEVVVVGFGNGAKSGVALVAEVKRSGIGDFLQSKFVDKDGKPQITVVTPAQLVSLQSSDHRPYALVRDSEVIFSGNVAALTKVNAQLSAGVSGLDQTAFGQRIQEAYNRGAGFLLAANLQTLIAQKRTLHPHGAERDAAFARSGFGDMRYLVLEHRELNQVPENRMTLDFAAERRGIPSWLAAPSTMGSLDFVSRNAAVAISFVAKDPQAMFTDIFNMSPDPAKAQAKLTEAQQKLNLNIQQDLAAHFGGDAVLALDGPVLPTPAWKFVVEVHDASALQTSLQTLVASLNNEMQQHGKPGIDLTSEDVNGQRFYTVQHRDSKAKPAYYTFANGYMIVGPDRATLMNTLQTRANGDSLSRSNDFKALLPKDGNSNYSFIAYQNLAPILQPLLSTVNSDQAKVIEELASDSRPNVICGWGRDTRIEAITNSRLFGFDWMAVGSLISRNNSQQNAVH